MENTLETVLDGCFQCDISIRMAKNSTRSRSLRKISGSDALYSSLKDEFSAIWHLELCAPRVFQTQLGIMTFWHFGVLHRKVLARNIFKLASEVHLIG
ncbi:hypothetical protein NPIL_669741 [Nephila pilipes]|uniref:Uncharacterized protein n=1 Tax=Nephila pilipes TaxID=299642 RepID=A0A8X6T622_NEPPI|nr:hypothetical protein NPIL_669741 [Nephila pilipes]